MDFTDKRFSFEVGEHQGKRVIWIRFEKNSELIAPSQHTKAWWSRTVGAWYVADNKHYRLLFGIGTCYCWPGSDA